MLNNINRNLNTFKTNNMYTICVHKQYDYCYLRNAVFDQNSSPPCFRIQGWWAFELVTLIHDTLLSWVTNCLLSPVSNSREDKTRLGLRPRQILHKVLLADPGKARG